MSTKLEDELLAALVISEDPDREIEDAAVLLETYGVQLGVPRFSPEAFARTLARNEYLQEQREDVSLAGLTVLEWVLEVLPGMRYGP